MIWSLPRHLHTRSRLCIFKT